MAAVTVVDVTVIDVIVVSHDGAAVLARALRSILSSVGVEARVIVVDNDSADASREAAAECGATVIALPRNVGYGAALNVGLEHSTAEWVACSNQDIELLPATLSGLVEGCASYEDQSGTGCIAAPQLLTPGGIPAESCHRFPSLARQLVALLAGESVARVRDRAGGSPDRRRCDWVSGAFLVGRASTFRSVNGFDGNYFMYVEDLDFLRRIADSGRHCLWVPDCQVLHWGGAAAGPSAPTLYAHSLWNLRTYYRNRNGAWAGWLTLAAAVIGSLGRAVMWWARAGSAPGGRGYARMFAGAAIVTLGWAWRGGPAGSAAVHPCCRRWRPLGDSR